MAVNNLSAYNPANDGMALPLSITRGNPNPLDDTYLYDTLTNAQAYAASGATAYVGQTICVLNTDVTDGKPTVYVISDAAGTLKPVGDAADVFGDTQFTSLKARVDILDNIDDTVEGSVAHAIDQSKISVALDTTVSSGTAYNIYQGQTITKTPILDGGGDPVLDGDGNPTYTITKTPIKVGTIGIDQDLFVSDGKVVSVDATTTQATDDTGALVFEADGITPVYEKEDSDGDQVSYNLTPGSYLKLILSNNSPVYIPTSSLAKGLATSIKTATHTYTPDNNGLVDMSTTLSTDDIVPGTNDVWVLNGGSATI